MEPRKAAIMQALDKFVGQRPGLEFGNYGDVKTYRAEMRSITRDRHDYQTLARAVERSDSITADMLIKAAQGAFSGRLTILSRVVSDVEVRVLRSAGITCIALPDMASHATAQVDYVTGQYFPTEYRKAATAILASALWEHVRETCMPPVAAYTVREWGDRVTNHGIFTDAASADENLAALTYQHTPPGQQGTSWGHVVEMYHRTDGARGLVPDGDWLRAYFRREFGRSIANRWFS